MMCPHLSTCHSFFRLLIGLTVASFATVASLCLMVPGKPLGKRSSLGSCGAGGLRPAATSLLDSAEWSQQQTGANKAKTFGSPRCAPVFRKPSV